MHHQWLIQFESDIQQLSKRIDSDPKKGDTQVVHTQANNQSPGWQN